MHWLANNILHIVCSLHQDTHIAIDYGKMADKIPATTIVHCKSIEIIWAYILVCTVMVLIAHLSRISKDLYY